MKSEFSSSSGNEPTGDKAKADGNARRKRLMSSPLAVRVSKAARERSARLLFEHMVISSNGSPQSGRAPFPVNKGVGLRPAKSNPAD
jgi:hypothetical protein